jgi:hypothetical protein
MNWSKIKRSIPDRVLIGVGGIAASILFVSGPRLLATLIALGS